MRNLVVVDDSADQLELIGIAIESLGCDTPVACFTSGEDCIAAIERGAVRPGLILLDVNMPGLDGPAAAARIRQLAAGRLVTIVMMSTSDQPADVRRSLEAGADSYVMKPVGHRTWNEVLAGLGRYWHDMDLGGRL
jgi:two-component system response regulator